MTAFDIDPDIRRARTLPARVYRDPAVYDVQRERVFARSWHLVPDAAEDLAEHAVVPHTLLPGCLDEPALLVRDGNGGRGFANVCTHRGNLLCGAPGSPRELRCRYHGRRFGLDGRFLSMPEFEDTEDFPSADDDLSPVPLAGLGPLRFAAVDPAVDAADWLAPVRERTGFLDWDALRRDPAGSRTYSLDANWALYCDNYLEGFHIPFVHPGLHRVLDYAAYDTELLPRGVLQVGTAADGGDAFRLPADHPDAGRDVAAFYFWLFPATMLNVYPWGVSVNAVRPRGPARTDVLYRTYVLDESARGRGAGGDLHTVELEDQAVVEAVQRGVRSRLYDRGRYSPSRERGVHHFHRLLAAALA